jgi:hypothetical protein
MMFKLVYEGEPDPKPKEGEGDPKLKEGTFSQEQVNEFLAKDRRKHQETLNKTVEELNAFKAKSELTAAQRKELDDRIEQLQSTLMTKEELAEKEKKKLTATKDKEIKELSIERDKWKGQYTESTIVRSIKDACGVDAYNDEQVVSILKPNTRLTEVLDDDGKPTGKYQPMIKFDDVDKDGKPVTLDLKPADAIKRMKEMDRYLNLWKVEGSGGIGSTTKKSKTEEIDAAKLAKENPELYRKLRKEGKITL